MKRFIIELFALLLLTSAACAESVWPEGITEENGRLTGSVQATHRSGEVYTCQFDCPVPPETIPDDLFEIGFRFFSKKDMQKALKAAGQTTKGQFSNNRDGTIYEGNWNAEASADISPEDAKKQAIDIALAYFDALGVEVVRTPENISRPYDIEARLDEQLPFYTHAFSNTEHFLKRDRAQYNRAKKFYPKQTAYTVVEFTVCLNGIPIRPWLSYPAGYADEPDAGIAYHVGASATVSDSGILVKATTDCIPELKQRRPRPDTDDLLERVNFISPGYPLTSAYSAQEAVRLFLEGNAAVDVSFQEEDQPFLIDKSITEYAFHPVITSIHPVLHTTDSKTEWACFWQIDSVREYKDGWRTDW